MRHQAILNMIRSVFTRMWKRCSDCTTHCVTAQAGNCGMSSFLGSPKADRQAMLFMVFISFGTLDDVHVVGVYAAQVPR